MGIKTYLKDPLIVIPVMIIVVFVIVAVVPGLIAPEDPLQQNLRERLKSPDWSMEEGKHFWGTDQFGRDIFSRVMWGTSISILIGLTASTAAVFLGVPLGLSAGWYGGWFGRTIMRIVDMQLAFPFLVLAIAIVATIGPSTTTIVLILAIWNWAPFARVSYTMTSSIKEREYIQAARAIGCSGLRIMSFHILPGLVGPLLVLWSTIAGVMIVVEGSLSFLGFGVQPPTPSWGTILSEGQGYIDTAWWIATFPGFAIMLIVLAFNALADGLARGDIRDSIEVS